MKEQRYQITFAKTEEMRFTSHLDLILAWERTFRRADLPLAYSEGFTPRPLFNLAAPLPLGYTSQGEIGDFWLSAVVPLEVFSDRLQGALPPGLALRRITEVEEIHGPKLPALVRAASYLALVRGTAGGLETKIAQLLESPTLVRVRREKSYDLRPLIRELSCRPGAGDSQQVLMTLANLPGATGRPDEVLASLGIPPLEARVSRLEILLADPSES